MNITRRQVIKLIGGLCVGPSILDALGLPSTKLYSLPPKPLLISYGDYCQDLYLVRFYVGPGPCGFGEYCEYVSANGKTVRKDFICDHVNTKLCLQ